MKELAQMFEQAGLERASETIYFWVAAMHLGIKPESK